MKSHKSARQLGYDELFDEVCFRFEGKHAPKNEEERLAHCELINDTIKITKQLICPKKNSLTLLIFESETTKTVYSYNGKEVVVVKSSKDRPIGKIMNGFDAKQLEYVYNNNLVQFWIGEAKYNVMK